MEVLWLVLLVMIPLVGGGFFALYRQKGAGLRRPRPAPAQAADPAQGRRRLPHGFAPMSLLLGIALIAALVAAVLLRSLLVALNAPF